MAKFEVTRRSYRERITCQKWRGLVREDRLSVYLARHIEGISKQPISSLEMSLRTQLLPTCRLSCVPICHYICILFVSNFPHDWMFKFSNYKKDKNNDFFSFSLLATFQIFSKLALFVWNFIFTVSYKVQNWDRISVKCVILSYEQVTFVISYCFPYVTQNLIQYSCAFVLFEMLQFIVFRLIKICHNKKLCKITSKILDW